MSSVTIVIPARFASSRLPEKMLLDETGWPLIRHVFEQAKKVKKAGRILIATDDQRIVDVIEGCGGEAIMTSPDHPNGTSRIAEVAAKLSSTDIIVNVQGDEPEIEPEKIEALIDVFMAGDADMGTLVTPFPMHAKDGPGSPLDPNCVKAVLGAPVKKDDGNVLGYQALYFSRSPIPYARDHAGAVINPADYFLHLGIYAYRPAFLQKYINLPQGKLENTEKLEQLRVLENGFKIVAGIVPEATPGIDTRIDYDAFLARWQRKEG
jgi:3-deoxy-manno-octulosonate cytidylyltransferase (CMP-KDO synthetase)